MSNLEHLLENGIDNLEYYQDYDKWYEAIKKDPNWEGNKHFSIGELWTICQYIVWTYKLYLIEEIETKYGIEINV